MVISKLNWNIQLSHLLARFSDTLLPLLRSQFPDLSAVQSLVMRSCWWPHIQITPRLLSVGCIDPLIGDAQWGKGKWSGVSERTPGAMDHDVRFKRIRRAHLATIKRRNKSSHSIGYSLDLSLPLLLPFLTNFSCTSASIKHHHDYLRKQGTTHP
jgi:hypothetical protein